MTRRFICVQCREDSQNRSRNWIPNQNGTGFWGGPAHVQKCSPVIAGSHSLSFSTIESALPWSCGRRSPIVN